MLVVVSQTMFSDRQFTLRLLHTNDHHGHLEPVKMGALTLGGIAQRQTLVNQLRAESASADEPLLLLSAGDIFQGTLYFNQYLGQADLDFYNAMAYNAATIGNHEFDRGPQVLADFIAGAEFPTVSANIEVDESSPLAGKIKPWVILKLKGEKIGIFGLTTEETSILSNSGAGVRFTNHIQAAKQAVRELTSQGVNKIIALTHIGFPRDLELASQVDGIDVVVGGHSHTPLGNISGATHPYPVVAKTPDGSPVLIVTDWEWGKYLGDLHLTFDRAGTLTDWAGKPHIVDATIPPDPAFQAKLVTYAEPLQTLQQQVIGQTSVLLEGDRARLRTSETNLGNLVADAILAKTRPDGCQIAILNSGGIRISIPPGPVTVGQVLKMLPFGNTIARLDLTGEQIKAALEHGVSQVELAMGSFPQVAGLQFVWNPHAPAGDRIVQIQVQQQDGTFAPLQTEATYRVVTNDFLLKGGDGYSIFTQGNNQQDTGYMLVDVVSDYIHERSPVGPERKNRIVRFFRNGGT
ncbi:MAG: 5'-nucleotidase C-terminal domain-containing protein [Hormoscilla sp. GUM202]|nr:5'-nucleotidase C-terminal domain-containing protein [Hormoscilla sp. GUM202]